MKKITIILIVGAVLRLFAMFYMGEPGKNYYWEYGAIAKNIIHDKGYSLFYFQNGELEQVYNNNVQPFPSAYMPPGYVYFLLPFMYIKNDFIRDLLIISIQIALSILSVFLLYKLTKKIFSENTALLTALIAAILPEFVFSTISYTPTVLYQLLLILLLLILMKNKLSFKNILVTCILISIIIYLRTEFILFWLFLAGVFLFSKKIKQAVIIFGTVVILIIPWSIRNIVVFHEPVLFTTSFGLNLYRGNNPLGIGVWGSDNIFEEINNIRGRDFEITYNKIYTDAAFNFIETHPVKVIENSFVKLFYTLIYYPNDSRTSNPLYFIPAILLSLFFIYSLFITFSWDKFKYFYLFFLSSIIIAVIFSPLPRYITMMKIMEIPFAAYGIIYSLNKLTKHPGKRKL